MIFLICLIQVLLTACVTTKTVVETKIEYISPDIPKALLDPCDIAPETSFSTNGELLMSYITLQSLYTICSSKVSSISLILETYNNTYNVLKNNDNDSGDIIH